MEPQRLQSGQGAQWIKRGYALFMKAPLLWIVLLLICFVAAALLSALPIVGDILVSLLTPVIMAGLMSGCRALEKEDDLELAHLFSGFQHRASQLITLGGISIVAQMAILGIMMLLGGSALVGIMMSGQQPEDPQVFVQAIASAGLAILVGVTLFSIWAMAMQFAPMLVFFDNIAPVDALKLSFRGFLLNIWPMLVYGLLIIVLAVLASLPIFLGWLVLLPVMFTSFYASYCAVFPAARDEVVAAGDTN